LRAHDVCVREEVEVEERMQRELVKKSEYVKLVSSGNGI
jgi:hypothetical protein